MRHLRLRLHLLRRNDRGETLIEVLAAILVATLSVALLFSCVAASSKMDRDSEGVDDAHYAGLTAADAQSTPTGTVPPDAHVTITMVEPSPEVGESEPIATATVKIYGGDEGGMYSYKNPAPGITHMPEADGS